MCVYMYVCVEIFYWGAERGVSRRNIVEYKKLYLRILTSHSSWERKLFVLV